MGILAFRKQRKILNSTIRTIRTRGILVNGPYRMRTGTLVFRVADDVVTEDELLRIPRDERLGANSVHQFLAEIKKRPT